MGLPLALTLGEPAGIGPDITLKLWHERASTGVPAFYVIGDPEFLRGRAERLSIPVPIEVTTAENAAQAFGWALPVIAGEHAVTALPGKPDATSAPAAVASIRKAVEDVVAGRAAAVVTNPVSKAVLYRAGFDHPGHTEFLAHLAGEVTGAKPHPVMMLWSPDLAVVPVTIHVPLAEVARILSEPLIIRTGEIVAHDLARRFGIARPRLAVAGLNPHAGEDGAIGSEDEAVIRPAVHALQRAGFDVAGPLPADTLFTPAARRTYDAALCMFHDQALIPIKTLAFDNAVNVTLGLPFVRTSPDHGTAFDLAGTGRASTRSLLEAVRLAARIAEGRTPHPSGSGRAPDR